MHEVLHRAALLIGKRGRVGGEISPDRTHLGHGGDGMANDFAHHVNSMYTPHCPPDLQGVLRANLGNRVKTVLVIGRKSLFPHALHPFIIFRVVLINSLSRWLEHPERYDFEVALFKPPNNLPRETLAHAIGLYHKEGPLFFWIIHTLRFRERC